MIGPISTGSRRSSSTRNGARHLARLRRQSQIRQSDSREKRCTTNSRVSHEYFYAAKEKRFL
jgi:hypothetical protein